MKRTIILIFTLMATIANAQTTGVERKLRKISVPNGSTVVSAKYVHGLIDTLASQGNILISTSQEGNTLNIDLKPSADSAEIVLETREAGYDTTQIMLGRRRIYVVSKEDKKVSVYYSEKERNIDVFPTEKRKRKRFYGYSWESVEWGINGFVYDNSITMPDELNWLDLRQARSWNFNINPIQYSFGLGSSNVGMVTGLGISFNNYHFSSRYVMGLDANGHTVPDSSFATYSIRRNKLATFSFCFPLMVEVHFPVGRDKIFFATGVILEARVGGCSKLKYDIDGESKRHISKEDYNLYTFRYMGTVRLGYDDLYIFGNYSPMSFFEKDKGPNVNTFSIGLGLNF